MLTVFKIWILLNMFVVAILPYNEVIYPDTGDE